MGSTRALTDATGDVVGTATYSPYGTLQSHTGTVSKMGFAGGYTDALTDLQYNRARYYDPTTGQFITRDPLEALTRQPYAYANGDPLTYVDPSGDIGILSFDQLSDFAAGFGDAITLGATKPVREALGVDNVDYCSGAYEYGGDGGTASEVALGGAGLERGVGALASDVRAPALSWSPV